MEAVAEKNKKKKKKVSKQTEKIVTELNVNPNEESESSKLEDSLEATEKDFKERVDTFENNEGPSHKEYIDCSERSETQNKNEEQIVREDNVSNATYDIEKSGTEEVSQSSISESLQPLIVLNKNEIHRVSNEPSSLDKYLNRNKQILQTLENIDSIPAQVSNRSKKLTEQVLDIKNEYEELEIKPYTEQQLSALYYNSELDMLEEFTNSYVEAELRCLPVKQHCLYDLLVNYLKVREKITGNNLEIEQLRREYKDLQNELWTMETATVTGRAECQDGQIVSANHNYNKSVFHRSVFQNIVRHLGIVQKLLYENHVLYCYSAEDLRLQIELYIQSVVLNAITVTQINRNTPISLSMQAESAHVKPYMSEVRLSISVLFAFQRKLIRDPQFLKETRDWLTHLVAVLLRAASYQDHLFLINHILRCPAGVSTWAAPFIQVPLSLQSCEQAFADTQINHLLSILSVILSPVKERDKFLKDIGAQSHMFLFVKVTIAQQKLFLKITHQDYI